MRVNFYGQSVDSCDIKFILESIKCNLNAVLYIVIFGFGLDKELNYLNDYDKKLENSCEMCFNGKF